MLDFPKGFLWAWVICAIAGLVIYGLAGYALFLIIMELLY